MSSDRTILIDGMPGDRVSAADRGLNYGDGVFRTVRVSAHEPVAWATQMATLAHDCRRLRLPVPHADTLYGEARRLFAGRSDGVLKIVITRGSGGRGYAPPQASDPVRIVSAHPTPPADAVLDLAESSIRLARQPALAGVKHLNRLEQVLARRECAENGWRDALMLDCAGYVIGTTMRNVVLVSRGQWLTPALCHAGVAGATRRRIMAALAGAGRPVTQAGLTLSDCYAAQAMMACNSVSGVTPVRRLGTHEFRDSLETAAYCRDALNATLGPE